MKEDILTLEEKRHIKNKDKMRLILKDELLKIKNLHENDLNELEIRYSVEKKKLEEKHGQEIIELQVNLKENQEIILSVLEEAEEKKGGIVNVEELSSVLSVIEEKNNINNINNIREDLIQTEEFISALDMIDKKIDKKESKDNKDNKDSKDSKGKYY